MQSITFITGNQKKADYMRKLLMMPIEHIKLDLDEIQSLDLREVVEHKVRQAYDIIHKPVIVGDIALEFCMLGRLPGSFIKFFEKELGYEKLCRLIDGGDRTARAKCTFGYYDGNHLEIIEGRIEGTIATSPRGSGGFGWDQIFIPYFTDQTCAELDQKEYERFYLEENPIEKLRTFLLTHNP